MYKKWVLLPGPKGDFLLNLENVTHVAPNGAGALNIFFGKNEFIICNLSSLSEFETRIKNE